MKLPNQEVNDMKEVLEVTGDWIERGYYTMAVANLRAMADYLERRAMGGNNPPEFLDIAGRHLIIDKAGRV